MAELHTKNGPKSKRRLVQKAKQINQSKMQCQQSQRTLA